MATFHRDEDGKWVISRIRNPMPYAVTMGAAILIGATALVASSLATAVTPAKPKPKPLAPRPPVSNRAPAQNAELPELIAPEYGSIRLGAFSAEAAHLAGLSFISTTGLAEPKDYAAYRKAVRHTYGCDLEDMNYFSLAPEDLDRRTAKLKAWMLMAGQYGDVTLALEPLGDNTYDVFQDAHAMGILRNAFHAAKKRNITVWVRFASESNLKGSEYSAVNEPEKFYAAAESFRAQMPANVKMVFSPLLNTFAAGPTKQKKLAKRMLFGPNDHNVIWDRIGGTLYRTDIPLEPTFRNYYDYMAELAPGTPFQICELGGPYDRRQELLDFLELCSEAEFPQLVKVNLFARDINRRADPNGEFGYLEPVARKEKIDAAMASKKPQQMESFLKPILESARAPHR